MSWTGVAAYYAKRYNKRFIWAIGSEEDVLPFRFDRLVNLPFNFIDNTIANYGKKNCDVIIAQAKYQERLLFQNYNLRTNEIISNYHPYPLETIEKSDEKLIIIWVANFSLNKQPEKFLELAEQFQSEVNLEFLMIGRPFENDMQEKIERRIESLKNTTYLGNLPQEQVNLQLSKSHILINTSLIEGFSNVFIQAMLRKNIVISLNSNPDNILTDFFCGFNAEGNFPRLCEYLKIIITDEKLLKRMGENAYQYATSNHLIENQIGKILKYLE
jgi:glycosyltransferase involved in cell wall biosynthesis